MVKCQIHFFPNCLIFGLCPTALLFKASGKQQQNVNILLHLKLKSVTSEILGTSSCDDSIFYLFSQNFLNIN